MQSQDAPGGTASPITNYLVDPNYISSLPWVRRERVTYEQLCEIAREKGLSSALSPRSAATSSLES